MSGPARSVSDGCEDSSPSVVALPLHARGERRKACFASEAILTWLTRNFARRERVQKAVKVAVGIGAVAGIGVLAVVLLTGGDNSAPAPASARVVAKECRATADDYPGVNLARQLIACHEALGRPYPRCSDLDNHDARLSGGPTISTPVPNPGLSLAYVKGYPPCTFGG